MSRAERTRARILDAARAVLEGGGVDVSMSDIAREAGVTRQLLYHHFDGRGDLLLQMSRRVDLAARSPDAQAAVDDAPDALEALRRSIALQGAIKPRIDAVVMAVDRLRASDVDAAAAWREREEARLSRVVAVVERLAEEGRLSDPPGAEAGARFLWSLTSHHAWRGLVVDGGWTSERWVQATTLAASRLLVADL